MSRLWQTLMLARWKPLFVDMPLESVIKTHQQEYYKALGSADSTADSTVFITFMLKAILQTLENAPVNIEGLKTPDTIITLIEKRGSRLAIRHFKLLPPCSGLTHNR